MNHLKRKLLLVPLTTVAIVIAGGLSLAGDDEKGFKPKCPISGGAPNTDVSVDCNGGKGYLCCSGYVIAYREDSAKYAAKANHQLVGTGQAEQNGCPLTGGKTNPSTTLEIAGVDVNFCCGGCRGKVAKAEKDAQIETVFGAKAFAKGFLVASK
jgi:hypothetical protein